MTVQMIGCRTLFQCLNEKKTGEGLPGDIARKRWSIWKSCATCEGHERSSRMLLGIRIHHRTERRGSKTAALTMEGTYLLACKPRAPSSLPSSHSIIAPTFLSSLISLSRIRRDQNTWHPRVALKPHHPTSQPPRPIRRLCDANPSLIPRSPPGRL